MADAKISALPAASALTGAELVPVVQGGVNAKATALQVSQFSNQIYTAAYADPNVAALVPNDPTKAAQFQQDPSITLYNIWVWSVIGQTWYQTSAP